MNTMITEDTTTTDHEAIAELTRMVETLTQAVAELTKTVNRHDPWIQLIVDGRLN